MYNNVSIASRLVEVKVPSCIRLLIRRASEAVLQMDASELRFTEALDTIAYSAMGVGPGLGTDETTALSLISQLRRANCPVVIDADAINILGDHKGWMTQIPQNVVFTPHPGEMQKLGICRHDSFSMLLEAVNLCRRHQFYIIFKGHHSAVCTPEGKVFFNTTGNSGMATAGSGDVLTGIITALLARGYDQRDACAIGMYLHGLAGDIAAKELGKESLIASDIINYLPKAFKRLE